MSIHPTTHIEKGAVVGENVAIGPYAFIGANVVIGDGCRIEHHATIDGYTTLGKNNHIFPYASIGTPPQDLSFEESQVTKLVLGDANVVREFVTINRGTMKEPEQMTAVGSNCLLMTNVHIAHDCVVGDNVIMANNCMLGGHVRIGDNVVFGGFVGIHHFTSIGDHAFVGGWSRVRQDVPPFLISEGVPMEVRNLNYVGLRRAEISEDTITELRDAYKFLFRSDLMLTTAIRRYEAEHNKMAGETKYLLQFLKNKIEGPNGRYLEGVLRK
ncbi:acyl-ACP--UDP-N-acetylglucosamine O-acyltransferase [Planctomycetota bacterium]